MVTGAVVKVVVVGVAVMNVTGIDVDSCIGWFDCSSSGSGSDGFTVVFVVKTVVVVGVVIQVWQ